MGVENWEGAREYLNNNIYKILIDWWNLHLLPPYLPLHVHVWYFVCLEYEVCQKMDFLWCSETICTSSKFSRETDMHGYSHYNIILFCLIFYSLAKRSVNFRDDICLCDTKNLRFKVLLFQNSHAYIYINKKLQK